MSKSLRNYRSPQEIFDMYGADAMRWYFFANQPPWTSVIYSERAIKESIPEFLLRLWNVYSFFVVYANIDGFSPEREITGPVGNLDAQVLENAHDYRPIAQREELDRWILSELHATVAAVIERMDAYDNFAACERINAFVENLSNWYVRRSRERFWASDRRDPRKVDAYWTLYECLLTTTRLIAPFVPFVAETMWQNLSGVFQGRARESVHLCDYPTFNPKRVDGELLPRMALLREIASLGRAARTEAKLKVRQPLRSVTVVLRDNTPRPWLQEHDSILRDELNVGAIEYASDARRYVTYKVQPNFRRLGPRIGGLLPQVKQALSTVDGGHLLAQMKVSGKVALSVDSQVIELDEEDIQIQLQAQPGHSAAQGSQCVVILDTELTPELIRSGLANDVIRKIQDRRKELALQFTDRIRLALVTSDPELSAAIAENRETIASETLAVELLTAPLADVPSLETEIAGKPLWIFIQVV
jgi:isoleucyl-tRNA synthetase